MLTASDVPGKAKITLGAKGVALPLREPFAPVPPLHVQLVNSTGTCWSSTHVPR